MQQLLSGAFDYAGLLPPAKVSLEQAVKNYATYLRSADRGLLGALVCPARLLTELESCLPGGAEWPIAVIGGADLPRDFDAVLAFNRRMKGIAVIKSLDLKADGVSPIPAGLKTLQGYGIRVFLEGPLSGEGLESVKFCGLNAKLRLGEFPPVPVVARWLRKAIELELPFKVAGGVQHPVRCVRFVTYEPDSATAKMHGFLNVVAAAQGGDVGGILECEETGRFASLAGSRGLVQSVETCSFTEPIEELREIYVTIRT